MTMYAIPWAFWLRPNILDMYIYLCVYLCIYFVRIATLMEGKLAEVPVLCAW